MVHNYTIGGSNPPYPTIQNISVFNKRFINN
jgi:hypothetical protein